MPKKKYEDMVKKRQDRIQAALNAALGKTLVKAKPGKDKKDLENALMTEEIRKKKREKGLEEIEKKKQTELWKRGKAPWVR